MPPLNHSATPTATQDIQLNRSVAIMCEAECFAASNNPDMLSAMVRYNQVISNLQRDLLSVGRPPRLMRH